MDQLDSPPSKKTGLIVGILVILGVAAVGAGGFLVWNKKNGVGAGGESSTRELEPWCALRQEWGSKVDPLKGDIMLKSIKEEDKEARAALVLKRNMICQEYARKVTDLKVTAPELQAIEVALVKQGKVKSNVEVMIHNILTQVIAPDTPTLAKQQALLKGEVKQKMETTRAETDKVIRESLAKLGGPGCASFYRGTMTDEGTSGNPYTSWDELELQRTQAIKRYDDAIKVLEPKEQFINRIYHQLVGSYRNELSRCFKQARAVRPEMSPKLGFRVRLDGNGKVKGLAIEWIENRGDGGDEKFLDCVEKVAAKWTLPVPDLKPGQKTDIFVVDLDFGVI